MKKLYAGLIGLGLGVLVNSIDLKTSEPFTFMNPIGKSKEISYFNGENGFVTERVPLNQQDIKKIVKSRPTMIDKELKFDILGLETAIMTIRTVTDPFTQDFFSGILDSNGDIRSLSGFYELQSAHDSRWYVKK